MVLVSSKLKRQFERWIAPRIEFLISAGLTPNIVTLMGLASSFTAAICYLYWEINRILLPTAAVLVLLSGLLDAIDGVIARTQNSATTFGGFFDSLSDRYSDALVLAAIVTAGLCNLAWGIIAVVGSLMVSYTRARAEASGVKMESIGLAERAERMLLLAIVSFVGYFSLDVLGWGIMLLAVLSHLTVIQRTVHVIRETMRQ